MTQTGPFVVRVMGWEGDTVGIAGPFPNATAVATALEAAGWRRSRASEGALEAWWEPGGIEILPLMTEIPEP